MLRQEQDATTASPSEAPRVTPEELSRALTAIEARKQAEASRLAGTIPIDQAVSELHLDSTSEEIWAEVQAQRDKAEAARREQRRQDKAAKKAQAAQQQAVTPRIRRPRRWVRVLVPLVFLGVLFHNRGLPHFGDHSTHIAAPVLRPLAQIPDGKEVYADDEALVQVSEGKPPTQITVSENATGNRWAMVKVGAHVYLRGYIANTDSLQPLAGKALNVYNDDNAGELESRPTSAVTLRVDSIPLQKSGGDEEFSEVTIPNFRPDPLTTLSPWH